MVGTGKSSLTIDVRWVGVLLLALMTGCAKEAPAPAPAPVTPSASLQPAFPMTVYAPGEEALATEVIPAPGGEVVLPTAKDKVLLYEQYTYAPVRRAGDFLFLSGVVAGPAPGESTDVEAFKGQLRRTWQIIDRNLTASGASLADIVEIESFHVFGSSSFSGDATAHLTAMLEVKSEFMKPPHPAWTVVGVTTLAEQGALVEIKVTAYAPKNGDEKGDDEKGDGAN